MTYLLLLGSSFGELIPTGYVISFLCLPQTPLSIITPALLAHSVVDFHLHNGAVGLYFFFLCGVLVAVTSNRTSFHGPSSLLPVIGGHKKSIFIAIGIVFLLAVSTVQLGILVAAHNLAEARKYYVTSHLALNKVEEIKQRLQQGQIFDPLEGVYPFEQGNIAVLKEGRESALEYYLAAARRQPLDGVYLQRVAMMFSADQISDAATLMQEGYQKALNKEKYVVSWVEWLLFNGKRDVAIGILKKRLSNTPDQFKQFIPLLEIHSFTTSELEAIMPHRVRPWIYYGKYLEKRGEVEQAQYFRAKALDFINQEPAVNAVWFNQLIHFYRRHKKSDKAVEVLRLGVENVPDYAPFHVQLGDYYRKQGISYRAKEEYQRAVMLEPNNAKYRKKLRKIELDEEFGEL